MGVEGGGGDRQTAVLQHRHRHVLITVTLGPMERWRENKGTQRQVKGHRASSHIGQWKPRCRNSAAC